MTANRTYSNTRRRVVRRRPPTHPLPPAETLEWVSQRLNIKHDPAEIDRHIEIMRKRRLWLPDTPDVLPPPRFIFCDFLSQEHPGLMYGAVKTLKTSILCHIYVACAGKVDLFGHFGVDRAHCGPVVAWVTEGGDRYVLECLDKAASVYGLRRRSLDIEVQTMAYPLNSHWFLYTVADQIQRLTPVIAAAEPLYRMAPTGWDGSKVTTFDVDHFTDISLMHGAVPLIGHHDKRGEATSIAKSSGVGPAEHMGQWWHLQREGEWHGEDVHRLKLGYGMRGGGGGEVGLLVNDDTLEVQVVPVGEVKSSAGRQARMYDLILQALPVVADPGQQMQVGKLFDNLAGQIEVSSGRSPEGSSLRRRYLDMLIRDGKLRSVKQTGKEHEVEVIGDGDDEEPNPE